MKRILSILTVVCLLVVMAVPVFASDVYTVSGKWKFNSVVSVSGLESTNVNYKYMGRDRYRIAPGTNKILFYESSSPLEMSLAETANTFIIFDNAQVSSSFYTWLTANASPAFCDGSCAVPDENLDGICESCGNTFSLRNSGYAYTHSVTFNSANGVIYAEYSSNEDFTIRGYKYGTSYRVDPSDDVYCFMYLNDQLTYQGLVANHYPSSNLQDTVVQSTFNWYESSDGDLFFPLPLWETVERVTQGEMAGVVETVDGSILTLVLCGVGLMALLVVLSLFGKRSLIYRN